MFFLWWGWDREVPVITGGITVSSFDVRVFAIRRRPGRKAFEVRWRVAGRDRSRSFMTRALADSYRAELVRGARKGLAFTPTTGEPESWAAPEPEPVTWYQHPGRCPCRAGAGGRGGHHQDARQPDPYEAGLRDRISRLSCPPAS